MGTVKFGRNQNVKYPEDFDLPSDEDLKTLLQAAKDCGVNLLDTAPAYGSSEKRIGTLIEGERDDWIIMGKAGEVFEDGQSHYDFSADAIERSLNQSLERLKTDYLDMFLIHSDGNDVDILSDDTLDSKIA